MLGGVVLVAGYDLPDCIARLLVQVALALDALDAVGCDEKSSNQISKNVKKTSQIQVTRLGHREQQQDDSCGYRRPTR